jgi:hypothetical protein
MSLINETVAVWVSPEGAPVRLIWRARRFRVTDTPTPLTASVSLPDELLHFLAPPPQPRCRLALPGNRRRRHLAGFRHPAR